MAADIAAISEILKEDLEILSPQIRAHAVSLSEGTRLTWDLFPPDTQTSDSEGRKKVTDALPRIWEANGTLHPKFIEALNLLENESELLAVQAQQGGFLLDLKNQVKQVVRACRTCHKEFRKQRKDRVD